LHYELEPTAKALASDGAKDMLELAANGKSFKLKVCAAWAYGIRNEPSDNLLNLLMDEHEVVSYAARESCKMIAKKYTGRDVNFGPHAGADADEKADARAMWELAFRKFAKAGPVAPTVNNAVKQVGNVKKKTVQEILGIK